jgi:hypothetical protein
MYRQMQQQAAARRAGNERRLLVENEALEDRADRSDSHCETETSGCVKLRHQNLGQP